MIVGLLLDIAVILSLLIVENGKKLVTAALRRSSYPSSLNVDNSKENFLKKKRLFNSLNNMTIVPVSDWLDNQLKYSFLNDYDSRVIQNGIDLEVFKPSKSQIFIKDYNLQNKFIILGVASVWTERKGFFEFIKLRELLRR